MIKLFDYVAFYDKLIKEFNIKHNNRFNTYDLLNNAADAMGIRLYIWGICNCNYLRLHILDIGLSDGTGTFNYLLIKNLYTQAEIADGNIQQILPGLKDVYEYTQQYTNIPVTIKPLNLFPILKLILNR